MKRTLSLLFSLCLLLELLTVSAAAAKVTQVNLTVTEPVVGEKCSFKASLPETASTEVETAYWSGNGLGDLIFDQGNDYTVIVKVKIKEGSSNTFGALTDIKATVNGKEAQVTERDRQIITVKYTWNKVGGEAPETPESKLKDQLKALAAAFPATNGTTKNDVLDYLREKLPGAEVWSAGGTYVMRKTPATETADGFVAVPVGVTYNGATVQTFDFSATIPALNKSPDAMHLAADKALMEAAFKAFPATAKTTGDELLAAVNAAATHGTKAAWGSNYRYEAPTATVQGSINGDIILTLGEQKEVLSGKIKVLPVDGTAADAALDADVRAISHAVNALEPTNSLTQEEVLSAAAAAVTNGSKMTFVSFEKVEATYDEEGKVVLNLKLELEGKSRIPSVIVRIPKLRGALPTDISVVQDEWELLRLTNIERYKVGRSLLTMVPALQDAGDIRAEEIIRVYDDEHTRPDGTKFKTAIDSAFAANRTLGENAYKGNLTPAEAIEGWMNSPGHKANILHADYTFFGCGMKAVNSYKYWVQLFASGGGISEAVTNTGSLRFDTVDDMEKAYLICSAGELTSYIPLDREYMSQNGNQYTIYLKGTSVTVTIGAAGEDTPPSGNDNPPSAEIIPPSGNIVPPDFTDVPDDAYYAEAVDWAITKGVTTGTSATTFSPELTCTRSQVVTFLWRAQGCPEPKSTYNPFTDVKATDYFYKPVLWAVEQGITNGTSATTFAPNDICNGSHVITFLYRTKHPEAAKEVSNPFYIKALEWALFNDILTDTTSPFSTSKSVPRSDIIVYLYRSFN